MSRFLHWLRWRGILLLAALTPPCREVTQLLSRGYEVPLSRWTRLRLRVHQGICQACAQYRRQLELLHTAARRFDGRLPESAYASRLAPGTKERIKTRLRCERVG